jgi:RNA polymerase sigma factor (sigma-70 family)
LADREEARRFEQLMLPHLDAAYNLARWLLHSEDGAADIVQEAYLRAFKFFASYRNEYSRAWILTIVRNTCFTWIRQNAHRDLMDPIDEELQSDEGTSADPEIILQRSFDHETLRDALQSLSPDYREAIVLRELEGFSYKEISAIANVPIGTVMSRLARARKLMRQFLAKNSEKD